MAAGAAFLALTPAPVPQELKSDVLDNLKDATVFVVAGEGTGSGFLFLKRGTSGYIMTCEHVVASADHVTVVFWSGTPREKSFRARVVAKDPSRDIACLILKDAKDLPGTLEIGRKTEVKETETVYAAGFPFGALLAAGKKNPEISISKSSVTSIRRSENRDMIAVQISGEVNPGNSGGPLVTSDGRVVGVTAAKIHGTQTAFAVPAEEIQGFFKGRVKSSDFRKIEGAATCAKYEAWLDLVDPLGSIKGAGIAYIEQKQIKEPIEPDKDGLFTKGHPAMKSVSFKVDEDRASESVEFTKEASAGGYTIVYQCYVTRSDDQTVWTGPATLVVDFTPGTSPAAGRDGGKPGAGVPDLPLPPPIPDLPSPAIAISIPKRIEFEPP
jgi:hypothetical protein